MKKQFEDRSGRIPSDANVPLPIAIVGIGCRLPGGADDPRAFWQILDEGRDVVTEVPDERWPQSRFYDPQHDKPGKTQSKWGGIVENFDTFDCQFFGISPREAAHMDPQQRMLLESAWRAVEDGGQVLDRLASEITSVFVGISGWDYAYQSLSFQDRGAIGPYSNTGVSHSIAANRISYCLDLRGPSAAVDTACSSALLAVHQACQSIWNDDCTFALAGGVNSLLMPDSFIAFSRLNMLSPDGRCKAFDAGANGFVRSEGAAMVLLKRLDQALADNDRIYAVIRATAVNQDGRTPGMTVPSQQAQEKLIRKACRQAGVKPRDIQYVEAHGTGTLVGDPIEARALGTILGQNRPAEQPCLIGSVKTNIGHLEAGAGVASLIKVALSMYHDRIPANLHFRQPNPEIHFEDLRLRVPVTSEPWPPSDRPRLAGINCFGYGGTNVHVIVEQAPDKRPAVSTTNGAVVPAKAVLIPFSARSNEALKDAFRSWQQFVTDSPTSVTLADIAASAALRRSHHDYRATVLATSKEELIQQCQAFADDQTLPETTVGRVATGGPPSVAFVCSGQGPQWWAMGRELLQAEPIFRREIEKCDAIVRRLGPWSLLQELTAAEADSRMQETAISQPSIFAIQVALAAVWKSWGILPSALIGHSVGEVAAAYLAGVYDLDDAMRIIYQRGRCMDRASSRGRMLAASLTLDEARELVASYGHRVQIAAVNSPTSVTLSGDPNGLSEIAQILDQREIFCRQLKVEYAFHSAQMDPLRDELLKSLAGISPRQASVPMFSTVTGERVEGPELGPEYWWQNVRQMVRFLDGMVHLARAECDLAVELSPHPVLSAAVSECCQSRGQRVKVVPSLRRNENERATMLRSLAVLHTAGCQIDWSGLYSMPHRFLELPTYPWQRARLWFESDESRHTRSARPAHPLLGCSQQGPRPSWETRMDVRLFPYLADHTVQRLVIMPAAAHVEMMLAAACNALETSQCQVEDLRLANPCIVPHDEAARWVETRLNPSDRTVEIHGRPSGDDEWELHSSATVLSRKPAPAEVLFSPDEMQERCDRQWHHEDCYAYFQKLGLEYGPFFRGLKQCWYAGNESLGRVELPEELRQSSSEYIIHPALLDACFHATVPATTDFQRDGDALYLPAEFSSVRLYQRPTHDVWVHARVTRQTALQTLTDLSIYNDDGQLALEILGFRSQRAGGTSANERTEQLLYEYVWNSVPRVEATAAGEGSVARDAVSPGKWIIFTDRGGVGDQLAEQLRADNQEVVSVSWGDEFSQTTDDHYQIDPSNRNDMHALLRSILKDPTACCGIIHLWNLDAPNSAELSSQRLESWQDPAVVNLLHLVQAWDTIAADCTTQLLLVTRGAQSVGAAPEIVEVAQCAVIGFGRVVISEYPRFRCRLVDLDPAESSSLIDELLAEARDGDEEDEIAYRHGKRFVHRYVPCSQEPPVSQPGEATPYRLSIVRPGTLDGLSLQALTRHRPQADEVEIEVRASALNFSDVMKVLDLYPGLPAGPVPLGAECSGVVTRVGENVEDFRQGDEVLAVAPFAFASHVVTKADLVAAKPPKLSWEEAATIPIAFLTASYALEYLGRLEPGERLLIHAASGGVGLAALQLARRAEAEVFATAGSEEKREFLRQQGIRHVMDSRSLAFAEETLEKTEHRGVDLILNSLPGEAITRGMEILADYGRFLEIGKRDIYANSRLGLRPFRSNLSFFGIDLDRVMRTRPQVLKRLFHDLMTAIEAGSLTPLPHKVFPIDDVADAFRLMQKGKHIGKIVISMERAPAHVASPADEPIRFREDGSYLIAGGFGGFGMVLGHWLVDHGARSLVLMSRQGARSFKARQHVADLESKGAQVVTIQGDLSKETDVRGAIEEIGRTLPPLRGVFHAAMVLEDGLLLNGDRDWMYRVLNPKVNGAWNLHSATLDCPLDHFVLFSSLSSVFGHAGQANYAAANSFLDHLAHYRRAQQLPCLTVNWGYLGEVGYLAEREQLGERLQRQGVLSFTVNQALDALRRSLQRKATQISVMNVDWSRWRGLGVTGTVSPRFAHLLRDRPALDESAPVGLHSREELQGISAEERTRLVQELMNDKIAHLLGVPADKLDAETPLLDLGLDSLMAVELRNWIETELHVSLPIVKLVRSPSLTNVTRLLCEELAIEGAADAADEVLRLLKEAPEELLDRVSELSSDQVTLLLAKLLEDESAHPAEAIAG